MQQGSGDRGGAARITRLCFLLEGQRGCSWPPRGLLPPQSAPCLSGHPYLEEPARQLAPCGTPAREATGSGVGAASPGLRLVGQCLALDPNPAEPVVTSVACELARQEATNANMMGTISGLEPHPTGLETPDWPPCPWGPSVGPLSPQREAAGGRGPRPGASWTSHLRSGCAGGAGGHPGKTHGPATVPQEGPQSQPHRLTKVPSQVEGLQVYVCAQGLDSIRPTYRSEQGEAVSCCTARVQRFGRTDGLRGRSLTGGRSTTRVRATHAGTKHVRTTCVGTKRVRGTRVPCSY